MNGEKMSLFFAALFLWGISQGLSQANANETSCITSPNGVVEFTTLVHGVPGLPGQKGEQGVAGHYGRRGFPGPNFTKKVQELEDDFSMKISKNTALLMAIQECGTYSSSWRDIAYIDTTVISTANDQCQQYGLRPVNRDNNQVACGKPDGEPCFTLTLDINGKYSHVCGRVRGYQLKETRGFEVEPEDNKDDINLHYADGVLITRGNPRQHLWTYAASTSTHDCPCSNPDSRLPYTPTVTGANYSCESTRTDWDQPLWDRPKHTDADDNCTIHVNGWFYQNVEETDESIEVRWCGPEKDDIVTDKLQIWVQ